jgi:Ala-tRNA(Pro) deacylase
MDEKALAALLDSRGIPFRVIRHKPIYTIADACRELGITADKEIKNLLLRDSKGFFLLVLRGDKRADLEAIERARGAGLVRMATPPEVKEQTGVEIGHVNPFAYPVVFVDEGVKSLGELLANPDDNSVSFAIPCAPALELLSPVFGAFAKRG